MKLAVLAGGKGTRLGLSDAPKPMALIDGKPLLEHQIILAVSYGITDIYILSGYLADVIVNYFGDGSRWGANIRHIIEDKPLGTAGAVKQLEGLIDEDFIVFYGDTVLDIDLNSLIRFHESKGNPAATLLVHPNDHPCDSDLLDINREGEVIGFYPKPRPADRYYPNLVNAALYVLSPKIFGYIKPGEMSDFGKDIFPAVLGREKMYAYKTAEYIKDMGTKERLSKVEKYYKAGKVRMRNKKFTQAAIFFDRDGTINTKVDNICRVEDFELIDGAAQAIARVNASSLLSILVTNQPMIAKGLMTENDLKTMHNRMETLLGEKGAYLDDIFYCPHHPDKGFENEVAELKIDCECRKPKTGMIDEAKKLYNIAPEKSYIIGDSFRDILCGRNAGLTTVGVMTGDGCRDKYVEPDYMFNDIREAVDFIIDEPYKDVFDAICERIKNSGGKRTVAAVAGLARSGKTTLCRYLTKKLQAEGISVKHIKLDSWLVPASLRTPEMDVHARFRMPELSKDIEDILAGRAVTLKPYDPLTRTLREETEIIKLDDKQAVIIEGVTAFDVPVLASAFRIFVSVPEELRLKRLEAFYRWKGLGPGEINELIKSRQNDEYSVLADAVKSADMAVSK